MKQFISFYQLAIKFMSEMHLKQPTVLGKQGFTYSACGPFTKTKERTKKFKGTRDKNYICKYEFDKACFQHDIAYEDFKDLAKKAACER